MSRASIRRAMTACFRALAAEMPAEEWQTLAREVAADFFKLTNQKRSDSGHYKFKFDDEDDTKPEVPRP